MRASRAFRPRIDGELEERLALSGVSAVQATAAARAVRVSLRGSISGTMRVTAPPQIAADVPATLSFEGSGQVRPLGRASIGGSLYLGGFKPMDAPQTEGTLTLTGARGTLTLKFEGGNPPTSVTPPARLSYTIQSGTGAFANAKGGGFASLALRSPTLTETGGSASYSLTFGPVGRR